jgi:YidC/Oxa1 family membrane protein insertase
MERRVLLAIFLAFLVLYVWQAAFVKPVPKPVPGASTSTPAATTPDSGTSTANDAPAPAASANGSAAPTPPSQPAIAAPSASPLVAATADQEIRVETHDVIAVFTNRGARLKSWKLKHYFDQKGQPQELLETDELPTQPLPFTLRTANEALTKTLNDALYAVSGAPASAGATNTPVDLRFEYRDSVGVHVVKSFHLEPSSYIVSATVTASEGERTLAPTIVWGPAIGDTTEQSRMVKNAEGILFDNAKVVRIPAKDVAKQPLREGDFAYAGVDDNYFMIAALRPGPAKVTFQALAIPPPAGSKVARELVSFSIEPQRADSPVKFFAGPKDFDVLASIDRDVARSIDFGMFTVIVVPLLRSLKWVNGYVGNYGWSIIILTFIINAIMFPLRHKSVVSMRKMQEIQPEVKAIQERYSKLKATDPAKQKMNTELMALYKERGVNPASGCVPMLLTMPFIFAFYALLSTAIELRGAPWFGWIHDLSAHDPYFAIPIVMGATQIWQQRISPATGMDPVQQKMMLLMPVFFTFLFLWYPSGVALYWAVNNIWAIGQQYATNYMIGPPNIRAARAATAGERRMKRVGGGKTDAASRDTN